MNCLSLVKILLMLSIIVAITKDASALSSEHYRLDSYSYGEAAHVYMSSTQYSYESVGDRNDSNIAHIEPVLEDRVKQGSRTRRPAGAVFGIASTVPMFPLHTLSDSGTTYFSTDTDTPGAPITVVAAERAPGSLVEEGGQLDIPPMLTVENIQPTVHHMRLAFSRDRFAIFITVLVTLFLMRRYTEFGKKWLPF